MTDKVTVKLLFFAKAKDLIGKNEAEVFLSGKSYTLKTLLEEIINLYEVLQPLTRSLLLAVNEEYLDPLQIIYLKDGDNIAIMPPLSGG